MNTAIVERSELGGTCLNWGCIPSKALLRNAEVVSLLNHADEFGIVFDNMRVDFGKAIDRSRRVVKRLTDGVSFLLKKNNVTVVEGYGALKDANTVEVQRAGETLSAKNIIIATGARFRQLPNLPIDGRVVITSREALERRDAPKRAVIVGAGATGAEFAYLWSKYGAEVTLVELLPRLVPTEDEEVSSQLQRSFRRQGITSMTGSSVDEVKVSGNIATVTVTNEKGTTDVECDTVLVAVGAQGNVDGIGLEAVGRRSRARVHFHRRDDADHCAECLRDRRRHRQDAAGARGIGARRHGGRAHGGTRSAASGLRLHPASHVLQAPDRELRSHGSSGCGARIYCEGWEVPLHRERQGPGSCGVGGVRQAWWWTTRSGTYSAVT